VQRLEAFERRELNADEWRSFRLLNGVYGPASDGVMMLRAKLPAGIATPRSSRPLADVADRHGGGKGHVTTRQNVQFHFMHNQTSRTRCAGSPTPASRRARRAATRCATGRAVPSRGASPPAEPFDSDAVRRGAGAPLVARAVLVDGWPRKFKPSVGGPAAGTTAAGVHHDLGFLARTRDGVAGFTMLRRRRLSTLRRRRSS